MMRVWVVVLVVTLMGVTKAQEDDMFSRIFTYHNAGGNRLIEGRGTFPYVEVQDTDLETSPAWILGIVRRNEPEWFVQSKDGISQSIGPFVHDRYSGMNEAPPVMFSGGFYGSKLDGDFLSKLSHSLPLNPSQVVYVSHEQAVVLKTFTDSDVFTIRKAVNALPDSRIPLNDKGQIAIYSGATERYRHGVLGDAVEAAEMIVFNAEDLEEVTRITLPENDVFEGIMPFWADVDGDRVQDLVTTVSNSEVGARIRVYKTDGSMLAEGESIGQGGRWRHQLAFGAFGANGENELVAVRTPHIGGVVEFYRYQDGKLEIVAELPGFSSHQIGSRNLDMAVGGDFNGDGQLEIVLPDQQMQTLNGIQRTEGGAEVVWSVPLDGTLTTNLAAVQYGDGRLALAAGTDDGKLRVWLPKE